MKPSFASLRTVLPALTAAFLLTTALFTTSCSYNNVHLTSPLRKAISKTPHGPNEKARQILITSVPLGSSEESVRKLVRQHFWSGVKKKYDLPDSYVAYDPSDESYLCYRLSHEILIPIGGDWTEVVFVFDRKRKLRNVFVAKYGAWL
jgi:hypothetical protein